MKTFARVGCATVIAAALLSLAPHRTFAHGNA
jgi:hypothetical protein